MSIKRLIVALLVVVLVPSALRGEETLEKALQTDVILRALVDENQRNIGGLELADLARPYFIEYGLTDATSAWVTAEFGAVTSQNQSRSRSLRTDLRVGSYKLDNTNFGGRYGDFFGGYGFGGSTIPIEDDYNAIRQAIWWATDRSYKSVSETFVQKKAFMESKLIEDKPDDFSQEKPTVYLEDRSDVTLDREQFEKLAVALSALFRDYPDVQESSVSVSAIAGNKYLVNSEGTRLRTAGSRYSVSVNASVQAEDGMKLADSFSVDVRKLADLPSQDELSQRCRKMVDQLINVKNAPRLEETYTGPVLFEPEAAATLFASQFAPRFAGGQRPVGSRTNPEDFANKLNRRILPRFMSVTDDPLQEKIDGEPALGNYRIDDQGVPAQAVKLVEGGRLKALLMSRNPSKEFEHSNGHGRGSYGPRAAAGCLVVSIDKPSTPAEIKQELLDGCQDEGLPYGLRVAELGNSIANPLVVYKVFADGHEELVRGVEIARMDLKSFKRILAAGDKPFVLNYSGRSEGQTIVAPALLFEELDLAKVDRDFDKPPILPSPLARK